MNITDAARICYGYVPCGPQGETLALAVKLIGEETMRNNKMEAQASVSPEYRAAARELESLAINMVAHARGMVARDTVPACIKRAREALDILEATL